MGKIQEKFLKKTDLKLSSHYKFKKSALKGHYWFKSDCGETYRCLFSQSASKNDIHGMHTVKPVYNLIISRKQKVAKPKFDKRVSYTISVIVNNFFIKNPEAIISYICDDMDKKAKCRNKIFYKWYKSCSLHPDKYMINTNIDGVVYFGVLMLSSNSEKKKVLDYLKGELEDVKDKTIDFNF